ncbi:MAG TPA: Smr/MutS family protein [Chitinophagales bacterium]
MKEKFDKELLRQYMMGAANPNTGGKFDSFSSDVVDLHLYDETFVNGKKNEKYAIEYQLEVFEKVIDTAILQGKREIRIIHGNGKGKLRDEIHKLLKKHRDVASFNADYHPRYGWGSTMVYFF